MNNIFLLFITIGFTSCVSAGPALQSSSQQFYPSSILKESTISHYVKKGDSLWKISRLYSTSISELMKKNKITSPKDLKIGQIIYIPQYRTTKNKKSFIFPVNGEIISFFGENTKNLANNGIGISLNTSNKNVHAALSGKVVFARNLKGWGKAIILKHDYSFYTIYANISITLVEEDNYAKKGDLIGRLASNSNNQPVLHFEIRKNHIPQNPLKYISN